MLRRMRLAQLVRRLGVAHGDGQLRLVRAASRARALAFPQKGRRRTDASARGQAARLRDRGHSREFMIAEVGMAKVAKFAKVAIDV